MPPQTTSSRTGQKEALEILFHFQVVFKLAKFYEPNNRILQEQMDVFFSRLEERLGEEGEIQIFISQNSVFLNRTRVKFDFTAYPVYKFMIGEFQDREIGALTFCPSLTKDELTQFMIFLAKKEIPKDNRFDELLKDFKAASFLHILLEKLPPTEKSENKEKNAARMYFLGIYHLKEIFEQKREVLNFNLTKRWIQSMFNHIASDESFLYGLTNIKNYDEYTLNHSVNVSVLALALGRRLGLSRHELTELGVSSFLHDLGKLDIPKEILDKPAKLDPEERAIMEKHASLGAEKLIELASERGIPIRAIEVALEHHAKNDQSGYPKYIRKKSISLFSKIVKIVDYFDAITTKRIYRKEVYTKEEALKIMKEKSAQEFDPLIFKSFINLIGSFPIGSLIYLNTGEIGIVFENNPHASFAQRPKVKLITDVNGDKMDGPVVDLMDVDLNTKNFKRTIIKSLDPDEYNIQVSDYFLARAQ